MASKKELIIEKVIIATINCIEENGVNESTIRKIAEYAKVNIAAINYYFGSKDKLLEETKKYTISQAFSDEEANRVLDAKAGDELLSALRDFLLHLLRGGLRYPEITKMHLYDPFIHSNYSGVGIQNFKLFIKSLSKKISEFFPQKSEKNTKIFITAAISAIVSPVLFPEVFIENSKFDLKNPDDQENYINNLFNLL